MDNKKFDVVPFEEQEGKEKIQKVQNFMESEGVEIIAVPVITQEGKIAVRMELLKRVAKVEDIVSPIQPQDLNGGSVEEKTS